MSHYKYNSTSLLKIFFIVAKKFQLTKQFTNSSFTRNYRSTHEHIVLKKNRAGEIIIAGFDNFRKLFNWKDGCSEQPRKPGSSKALPYSEAATTFRLPS